VTDEPTVAGTRSPVPRVAPLGRLAWRQATLALVVEETRDARTLVLDVPGWPGHVAGQHVDVRLTAPDGYQATRSYSLASGPGEPAALTVQEVPGGEASTYLVRDLAVGETVELRGPIGGYFVWTGARRPLLLVGGGSGLAPLRAMWRAADRRAPVVVVASVTAAPRLLYAVELAERVAAGGVSATVHVSRAAVPGDDERAGTPLGALSLRAGRVDGTTVTDAVTACGGTGADPGVFVCGPTTFVEAMIHLLAGAGLDPRSIRAERFG
jgi:ferredoxin-NADP reductase